MTDPHGRKPKRRPRGAPLDHAPEGVTYAREQAGLTKQALAESLGISKQFVGDIEAGRRNAGPELLEQMAERLACPLVVLQAKGPEPGRRTASRAAHEPDEAGGPSP
ncbi:helix-turn-helix transcriptional regulator [Streptomyces sp. NPDC006355]|uniref:helix-turn-helix domain-containing protein n=1 Tax=Streptomyces sp. NPDC006355 TaxID=3156758 RepID=UPI0033A8CA91